MIDFTLKILFAQLTEEVQSESVTVQPKTPMQTGTKFVLFILAAWLGLAMTAGIFGWFQNTTAPGVAITVLVLTGIALLLSRGIPGLRNWTEIVDLRWLVGLHLTRFVGAYFLVLGARGALPDAFARPAGIGDIVVALGAVAILFLRQPPPRALMYVWNTLGLIDIVLVVFNALRCGLRDLPSMAPLRELPLSLLPMFIVPLVIVSHILIFIRIRPRL